VRCQLHRIGTHSAGTSMNQDRLPLFQVTVGEKPLPCSLGLATPSFLLRHRAAAGAHIDE
jgi:hypothetical protein